MKRRLAIAYGGRISLALGALLFAACAAAEDQGKGDGAAGPTGAGGEAVASGTTVSSGSGGAFEPTGGGGAPDTPETCGELVGELNSVGCEFWAADLDLGVNAPMSLDFDSPEKCQGWQFETGVVVCADAAGNVAGICPYDGDCSEAGPGFACSTHDLCVLDPQHATFAIALANPQAKAAHVKIRDAAGVEKSVSVAPGDVATVVPAELGFADHSLDQTGVVPGGYRIVSDLPIAAYQFNPQLGTDVFSADASLLLPVAALDGDYLVLTHPTTAVGANLVHWNGYFSVVATAPGVTMVEVTASAPVRAGDGVPALAAGEKRTFTLGTYDVLTLEGAPDADLSGSRVHADATVVVFAGHEAASVAVANPFVSPCCADHLEEQLPPQSVWGKEHVVAKSQRIAEYYWDRVKVLAAEDATIVSVTPSGQTCYLDLGESCEVMVDQNLAITASAPVLLMHLLSSGGGLVPNRGDPAIAFVPPIAQWRTSYTLLAPAYPVNYLSIVAPAASPVTLDGKDVGLAFSATVGTYAVARIPIDAGKHDLSCDDTCSVEVYGFGDDVSYMYAGGLNLLPQSMPR